jgi:fucose 4-O-acetylase-like acetyltransferase
LWDLYVVLFHIYACYFVDINDGRSSIYVTSFLWKCWSRGISWLARASINLNSKIFQNQRRFHELYLSLKIMLVIGGSDIPISTLSNVGKIWRKPWEKNLFHMSMSWFYFVIWSASSKEVNLFSHIMMSFFCYASGKYCRWHGCKIILQEGS